MVDREKIVIFLTVLFALTAALIVFISPTGLFIQGVVGSAIQNPSFEEDIIGATDVVTNPTQIDSADASWQVIGLDDLRLDYSTVWKTDGQRSVKLLGLPLLNGDGTLSQIFVVPQDATKIISDLNIQYDQEDGYGFRVELCLAPTSESVSAGICVRVPNAQNANPLNTGEHKLLTIDVPEDYRGKPATLNLRTIYKENHYVDVLWDNIRIV